MRMQMNEIILASASPRRRELLALAGIPFKVMVSDAPEVITKTEPGEIVMELSACKAEAMLARLEEADRGKIVLGADTIVYQDGRVLGKPADEAEAFQMLDLLRGREHSVFTGVTLLRSSTNNTERHSFYAETRVRVSDMSDEEIRQYIRQEKPFDKAGAYGIQGPFAAFVEGITGDYCNVVGLPLNRVYQALKKLSAPNFNVFFG